MLFGIAQIPLGKRECVILGESEVKSHAFQEARASPNVRAKRPAVGAPLERGVRPRSSGALEYIA